MHLIMCLSQFYWVNYISYLLLVKHVDMQLYLNSYLREFVILSALLSHLLHVNWQHVKSVTSVVSINKILF